MFLLLQPDPLLLYLLHYGMYSQSVNHMNPFFLKLLLLQDGEKLSVYRVSRNGSEFYFKCLLRINNNTGFNLLLGALV